MAPGVAYLIVVKHLALPISHPSNRTPIEPAPWLRESGL